MFVLETSVISRVQFIGFLCHFDHFKKTYPGIFGGAVSEFDAYFCNNSSLRVLYMSWSCRKHLNYFEIRIRACLHPNQFFLKFVSIINGWMFSTSWRHPTVYITTYYLPSKKLFPVPTMWCTDLLVISVVCLDNGCDESWLPTFTGALPGTVLGPLLCFIFIIDLPSHPRFSYHTILAYDTQINPYTSAKNFYYDFLNIYADANFEALWA